MKIAIGCDHGGINLKPVLVAYLKEKGFSVDEERFTEEEIHNSPFPIGVEMSTKKVFLISGAAMAGAAASKDMIFNAENFIKMFQELTENNPR